MNPYAYAARLDQDVPSARIIPRGHAGGGGPAGGGPASRGAAGEGGGRGAADGALEVAAIELKRFSAPRRGHVFSRRIIYRILSDFVVDSFARGDLILAAVTP